MGVPIPRRGLLEHAFVRYTAKSTLMTEADYTVVACEHEDMDGRIVVEALVSGPDAVMETRRRLPDALVVRPVRSPAWVEQCILAARGEACASRGILAVHALRASDDDLFLVSHPSALDAAAVLAHVSRVFE